MARLSQKRVLDEGIASILGAVAKKGAQAVGAAGSALKRGSEMGIDASWGGVAKAGAEGWEKTGEMLTGKVKKLEKFLDDQGLMKVENKPISKDDIHGKIAIVPVVQYDYDDEGKKVPMEGIKEEKRKFRYKDRRWEVLREKQRSKHDWGVSLDKEDVNEAKTSPDHPLAGKVIKHQTNKGGIAYGTVIGVVDEYAAVDPFEGNKAPGIYGKDINAIEESTEKEATQHYKAPAKPAPGGAPITSSFSQKNLLRQLHMLQG
tara:strand:- start:798 stop:1577 length:780 start_codon:yes stop_codon:yes gene_type:complete